MSGDAGASAKVAKGAGQIKIWGIALERNPGSELYEFRGRGNNVDIRMRFTDNYGRVTLSITEQDGHTSKAGLCYFLDGELDELNMYSDTRLKLTCFEQCKSAVVEFAKRRPEAKEYEKGRAPSPPAALARTCHRQG